MKADRTSQDAPRLQKAIERWENEGGRIPLKPIGVPEHPVAHRNTRHPHVPVRRNKSPAAIKSK